jgi:hypothetical protein
MSILCFAGYSPLTHFQFSMECSIMNITINLETFVRRVAEEHPNGLTYADIVEQACKYGVRGQKHGALTRAIVTTVRRLARTKDIVVGPHQ